MDSELVSGLNGGLALKVNGTKSYESLRFDCDNSILTSATCYVFEADLSILSIGSGTEGLRVDIGSGGDGSAIYRLLIRRDGDGVSLWDTSSVYRDYAVHSELGIRAPLSEWFKLRIEFYPMGNESTRVKIYFNDVLSAVSDNFYTAKNDPATATPYTKFDAAVLCSDSQNDPTFMVDNVRCYKTKDAYSPTAVAHAGGLDVDKKSLEKVEYTFDEITDLKEYVNVSVSGAAALVSDGEGKSLNVSKEGAVQILPTKMADKCNTVSLSFDISSESASGDVARISLVERNYDKGALTSFIVYVKNVDGVATAFVKTAAGEDVNGISFPIGEKNNLKMEYYSEEKITVFYLNGVKSGVSVYSSVSGPRMSFGSAKIYACAGITLDNVVCEKNELNLGTALEPSGNAIVYGEGASLDFLEMSGGAVADERDGDDVITLNGRSAVRLPVNQRDHLTNVVKLQMTLSAENLRSGNVCELVIEGADKTPKIAFMLIYENGKLALHESTALANHELKIFEFSTGEEHLIALEYYEGEGICNVYLDGAFLFVSTLRYTEYDSGEPIESALISSVSANAKITLDALRFESYGGFSSMLSPSYKNPEDNANGKITFEYSSGASLPSAISPLIKSAGTLTVGEAQKDGEVGKALVLNTLSGGYDRISVSPAVLGSGNTYVFEADVFFDQDNSNAVYEITVVSKGSLAYRLTVYAGTTVGVAHNSAHTGKDGYYAVGESGEWLNLRLEYSTIQKDGELVLCVNVIVNGTLIYTTDEPTSTTVYEVISSIDFCATTGAAGTVMIDNLSVYQAANK